MDPLPDKWTPIRTFCTCARMSNPPNQQALEGDHWLSNRHISAVNTLLRQQYPGQNGLQDTLELSNEVEIQQRKLCPDSQSMHVSQNHWVCVSSILSPPDIVEVFDSLPATFSSTLKRQVAAVLRCRGPQFTLCYIDVQHQNGADDCTLFAVAFAEALCAGKDLHLLTFVQLLMRQHLQFCLDQGTVTNFPAATTPRRLHRRRVKMSRNVCVYCKCRLYTMRRVVRNLGAWYSVPNARNGTTNSAWMSLNLFSRSALLCGHVTTASS